MLQASLGQNHNPISASGGLYICESSLVRRRYTLYTADEKKTVKAGSIFLGIFINVNEELKC